MVSVPNPRTWNVGDLLTAAELNSEIRDAINFLLNPPLFLAEALPATSLANSAYTALSASVATITIDSYLGWSSGNPTRYTPQVPGYYQFTGIVSFATSAAGRRGVQFWVNGAALSDTQVFGVANSAGVTAREAVASHYMNGSTDYVELRGFQDTGAALLTTAAASRFGALWCHP